jgi:hypothetical protein
MLAAIENGGKIEGIENWMKTNDEYRENNWEESDILEREYICLVYLKQNLNKDIFVNRANGSRFKINLKQVEESNNSNIYRKSEILRFAEDDGFDKISELCFAEKSLEKYIKSNCDM